MASLVEVVVDWSAEGADVLFKCARGAEGVLAGGTAALRRESAPGVEEAEGEPPARTFSAPFAVGFKWVFAATGYGLGSR